MKKTIRYYLGELACQSNGKIYSGNITQPKDFATAHEILKRSLQIKSWHMQWFSPPGT